MVFWSVADLADVREELAGAAVRAALPLLQTRGPFDPRIDRRAPPELLRLITTVQLDASFAVRLVPVAV